jgi:hypothetical protein
MPTATQWLLIETGVTALSVGVVSQAVSANIRASEPEEPERSSKSRRIRRTLWS